MAAAATRQTVRRWVMTGAVTAVTVAGTIYGAQLKDAQDVKKENKRMLEATPEERIAQLETAREGLVIQRKDIERKIDNFHARLKAKEEELRMGPMTKRDRKIAELREQMRVNALEKEEKERLAREEKERAMQEK